MANTPVNSTQANDASAPEAVKQETRYYIMQYGSGDNYTIYVADTEEVIAWAEEQAAKTRAEDWRFEQIKAREARKMAKVSLRSSEHLYECGVAPIRREDRDRTWRGRRPITERYEKSAYYLKADIERAAEASEGSKD